MAARTRILVLGGGVAGLRAALLLAGEVGCRAQVALVAQEPAFAFPPALFHVISGKLSPAEVTLPYAPLLSSRGITFIHDTVLDVDVVERRVNLASEKQLAFDFLLVALGTTPTMAQVPGMSKQALPLKTLADALDIQESARQTVAAVRKQGGEQRIVICGAGASGVELAGELRSLADEACRDQEVSRERVRIILVAAGQRPLPASPETVQDYALRALVSTGVELELSNPVVAVDGRQVQLSRGSIEAQTIIWTGGNRPNPVLETMGLRVNSTGGIFTNGYLQAYGANHVFVAGDCVHLSDQWQQARFMRKNAWYAFQTAGVAARNLAQSLRRQPMRAYRPWPQGFVGVATLGDNDLLFLGREAGKIHVRKADAFYRWLTRAALFVYRRTGRSWLPWRHSASPVPVAEDASATGEE